MGPFGLKHQGGSSNTVGVLLKYLWVSLSHLLGPAREAAAPLTLRLIASPGRPSWSRIDGVKRNSVMLWTRPEYPRPISKYAGWASGMEPTMCEISNVRSPMAG